MGEDPGTGGAQVNASGDPEQVSPSDPEQVSPSDPEQVSPSDPEQVSPSDPEHIRAQIEDTRQELGETVAALSAKTDVKAQAKERIDEAKTTVNEKKDELLGKARGLTPQSAQAAATSGAQQVRRNPLPAAVGAAFLGGFVLGRLTAARR